MRKLVKGAVLGLVLAFSACTATTPVEGEYELTLVHVNDIHGRAKEGKYDGVGLARVATIVKALDQDKMNGKVLLMDAGDTLHGTTFATLDKGASMVEVLNEVGFDYMTLGNHDFNYGRERLEELIKLGNYKTVAANVVDKLSRRPIAEQFQVIRVDGKKVGIFGLATPETYYKTNPKNVETLEILDPIETAKQVVDTMRKNGVDVIIALVHLGDDATTEERYQSTGLAKAVPYINVIIDGHSHTELQSRKIVNGVTIVQTGEYTKNVGVVKIDFDKLDTSRIEAIDYTLYTKDIILNGDNPVKEDPAVKAKIENIEKVQEFITAKVVGKTDVKLVGEREVVRTGESNLGQLATDAMLWKSGADVAITNGGGIRASVEPGEITVGETIGVFPFGNYLITKELTGAELQKAIEHGIKNLPKSAGSNVHVAGMTVKYNSKNPEYRRVTEIKVNGKKLDPKAKYIVATNDFMAAGGDGYTSLKDAKEVGHFDALDEVLAEYLTKVGVVNRDKITKRITSIN